MERNLENFFSEKIRLAEQKPVTWNKDTTWHLVTMSLEPQRKRTPFFYAAACLLMLVMLVGVQIGSYQADVDVKLTPLAASPIRPSSYLPIEEECKVTQQRVVNQTTHTTLPHQPEPEQITDPLPEPTESIDRWIAAESTETSLQPFPADEKTPEVQAVEPIIGIIIPERKTDKVVTEKKVKFRWFKPQEQNGLEPPDTNVKNVFARIN